MYKHVQDLNIINIPPILNYNKETKVLETVNIDNMNVSMASDAFFPFRDNIDKCSQYGVKYILQPGGSIRDNDIIKACDDYGILMCISGVRVFTH